MPHVLHPCALFPAGFLDGCLREREREREIEGNRACAMEFFFTFFYYFDGLFLERGVSLDMLGVCVCVCGVCVVCTCNLHFEDVPPSQVVHAQFSALLA
jgi:hypothetical protein